MEVLYFADFKDITGKNKEKLSLDGFNILELINLLFKKYNLIKNLIWEEKSNNLKDTIKIAINDNLVDDNDILDFKLSNGDRIAFLLPLSGG